MLDRLVTAAGRSAARGGEQQLPRQPRRGADDLDAARVPRDVLRPAQVRVPARSPRRSTSASTRSRSRSTRPSARAAEADELLGRVPRAAQGGARAGRRDRRPRAQGRRGRTSASRSRRPGRKREELLEQTRRDIEAETRRAIQEIRREVADLTVLATEKVTRKTLNEDDQQRLVDEALGELDFSALGGERRN